MALAEDLDALERSIRQIQIDWDRFFSGIDKKPPNDAKTPDKRREAREKPKDRPKEKDRPQK